MCVDMFTNIHKHICLRTCSLACMRVLSCFCSHVLIKFEVKFHTINAYEAEDILLFDDLFSAFLLKIYLLLFFNYFFWLIVFFFPSLMLYLLKFHLRYSFLIIFYI